MQKDMKISEGWLRTFWTGFYQHGVSRMSWKVHVFYVSIDVFGFSFLGGLPHHVNRL